MPLKMYNKSGKQVGTYDLEPEQLAPRINRQLLHDAVVMYQSNQRLGSSKTKTRSEVRGSTRKLYRQKGTGNARAGSRRSGIRRGGGHMKQIRPRDWSYRLPRKALKAATRMAMAAKIKDEEVLVIDELSFSVPKTRDMADILGSLKLHDVRVLVATAGHEPMIYKSARNIPGVSVSPVTDLNALSVLSPHRLLVTKAAMDLMKQQMLGGS